MVPKTLLGADVKLVPALGFTFAAIILGDVVQLLQAWKTKGLYFPPLSFFFFFFQFTD